MWTDDWFELRRQWRVFVAAHPVTLLVRRVVARVLGERHNCAECRRYPDHAVKPGGNDDQ